MLLVPLAQFPPESFPSRMPQPFAPFSAMHGWAILAGATAILFLILLGKRGGRSERAARFTLAFLCLSAFGYSQAAWAAGGGPPDLDSTLPLHMCDLAAFIGGFALLTGKRLLATLTYFWGLAATVQALATPAITVGFPHPAFISFFLHHFAIVGTAFYLPIVVGWRAERPWWKDPLKALMWANVYLLVAVTANALWGTNFAFAAHKPVNPSLLDHLGPWPLYLVWMQLLAGLFFSLLALPVLRRPGK